MELRQYRIRLAASLMTLKRSIGGSCEYPAELTAARCTGLVFPPEARLPNQQVLLKTREAESDSKRPTRHATSFNLERNKSGGYANGWYGLEYILQGLMSSRL